MHQGIPINIYSRRDVLTPILFDGAPANCRCRVGSRLSEASTGPSDTTTACRHFLLFRDVLAASLQCAIVGYWAALELIMIKLRRGGLATLLHFSYMSENMSREGRVLWVRTATSEVDRMSNNNDEVGPGVWANHPPFTDQLRRSVAVGSPLGCESPARCMYTGTLVTLTNQCQNDIWALRPGRQSVRFPHPLCHYSHVKIFVAGSGTQAVPKRLPAHLFTYIPR